MPKSGACLRNGARGPGGDQEAIAGTACSARRVIVIRVMVSPERVRQLALALPKTVEMDHHGRPSFRVSGRIFATLWDESHMNVMLDEPGIHTAVQGNADACEEFWWGRRLRAVHVSLDRAGEALASALLVDAWEQRAPKRLRKDRTGSPAR
jgi:hypothetical protein